MNKYIIVTGVLIVLVVLLLFGFSKNGTSTTTHVSSAISVTSNSYDFGDIDIFGGKVRTTYMLKNEGAEDITITSAFTSCMCTEGSIDDLTFGMHESSGNEVVIPAGETKTLTAAFDPLAHGPNGTGKITRELFLKTNSTVTPEIKVTFSGNVIKNDD